VNRPCVIKCGFGVFAALLCGAFAMVARGDEAVRVAASDGVRGLSLKDIHGKPHRPLAPGGQKATVVFFVLHDCPLANKYAPEINRIVAGYRERGVQSFVVYVEDDLPVAAARKHARDHKYSCPVLLDPAQQLVRFTGATVSPEAAVLGPDNDVLYRGRIDDRMTAPGKQRVEPTHRDLCVTLEAILAGKPVPARMTKAIGCYLPAPPPGEDRR